MRRQQAAQPDDPITVLREFLHRKIRNGLATRCRDGGRCNLGLDLEAVCISCDDSYLLDNYQGKRPDFFVATIRLADGLFFCWLFIEMKSGKMDLPGLYVQLQGGADRIEQSDLPMPTRLDFIPLVLRGKRGPRVSERESFNRYKVSYRGVKRTILIEACGSRLSEILRRNEGS